MNSDTQSRSLQQPFENSQPPAPLTRAQESLYFLDQLTNGLPVYHMPQAFRLRGRLNTAAFEQSIELAIRSHEALQSRIRQTPEGLKQFRNPSEIPFKLCSEDLSVLQAPERESALKAALDREIKAPFNLEDEPPFRALLIRLAPDEHVFFFMLHHVVGDMSSLTILFREIAACYGSFQNGATPRVVREELSLAEYAHEQHTRSTAPETLSFWRNALKDHTAELDFPLDRFRPRLPSFRGGAHYFELSPEIITGLRALARRNKCSLYMVGLAAIEILIHRYTGQNQFAIGTPFSDREDPRLENTVGYLVNLLPIPCDVTPGQPFSELLGQIRSTCLEAYSHHQISFRGILKELAISTESPKPPLARVVFQYFPETANLDLPGVDCSPIQLHSRTSKFDLCFSLWEQNGTVTTEIEFDSDIFEERTIRRIGTHLEQIFRSIVANPDQAVGELSLLSAEEHRQIISFETNPRPYPRDATVHGLFEIQADLTPNAVALICDGKSITYAQLNQLSNRIARTLQNHGVRAKEYVGICLDRSPELIASLLGILKSGAAFVPFDPKYPQARLEYLFADSAVRVLLTNSRHAGVAPSGTRSILLDLEWDEVDKQDASNLPNVSAATDIAYMMYTSGSTGNPKGAMIPHRAIVRLVKNTDFASFGPGETFLAFAPVSFDASTLEIWGALLNGARLAIYPPEFESVEQFEEVVQQNQVSTLWLTAGLFNTIVDRKPESLRGVRQLLVGGDTLSVSHIRKAQAALPETRIINGYGPTENTTFTCCYSIPNDWPENRSIPIGKPIANTEIFILDQRLQRVPIGVPGDLYTGGDGLSAGYWKQPELTASSFLPNPFDPAKRIYRTGDRARYLEDGTVEFLGRRDSQVKIRGFRIELGEIESVFRQRPGVRDAAVVVRNDRSGTKMLVAYLVAEPGADLAPARLQGEIASVLPSHACPSRIVLLDELPLGANGKVNRQALPAPDERIDSDSRALPGNPVEEKLVHIWRQILEIPALGIDDNFFHFGGESLRATRLVSQMNATFNCRLTLPRLFEAPTIRQMAQLVQNSLTRNEAAPLKSRSLQRNLKDPEVSSLTEGEVDALLKQLLATHDGSN